MSLRDLYRSVADKLSHSNTNAPPASSLVAEVDAEGKSISRPTHIVLCNDATSLHQRGQSIAKKLRKKGHDVEITCVSNEKELLAHLKSLEKKGAPAPDAVFMDVGGVGEKTALKVIKWHDKNHPDKPLPYLNFLSLDVGMGITEAGRLRESESRITASYVDSCELSWLDSHLDGGKCDPPASTVFREVLNARLGTTLPLDHKIPNYYAAQIKKMNEVTNDRVLEAWQKGKMPEDEVIARMRDYSFGLAAALQGGFYTQSNAGASGMKQNAKFYGSAGFPMKGPVVFSLQDAEDARFTYGEKPVLVMQSYDPEVVPVLASGRLGGLIAMSPYMASHLKLLCETHMVSGLFGMIPPGEKGLTRDFNEEARPNLPPYFKGDKAEIGGQTVRKGQRVLVGLGGDGISLNPPATLETKTLDIDSIEQDDKLRADLKNLQKINACFEKLFEKESLPPHGIKANIETVNYRLMESINAIGLVRTEQLVAASSSQMSALKSILLRDDSRAYENLFEYGAYYNYQEIFSKLAQDNPVKIRLFDFVHAEILNKDEQKLFLEKHEKLEIHGGEALATWPRLYKEQVKNIMIALSNVRDPGETPLEIMMPAVRTEKDTLDIKKIIDEEAQRAGIKPEQYSFGVMVETLESCKNIGDIAKHCDFISFGTNDLTQQYFTVSRSDLKAHARFAAKNGYDPFKKLGPEVLELIQTTTVKGREANPALKADVCGAQAADPETAVKLYNVGIDNISVAPTLGNIYALPVLLNYKRYDELKAKQPKPETAPSPSN